MIFVSIIIAFDVALVFIAVSSAIYFQWRPLLSQFPPRPFLEPFYRRNFQSFQVGALGLGFSIHVVLDDDCLHLVPIRFLEWFGCKKMSIPWDAIQIIKLTRWQARFRIGKTNVTSPRWCIEPRLRMTSTSDPT